MRLFFTSDTHLGHENIIKYSNRPFKTAEEMDRLLITNWNNAVSEDDMVIHLGDFAYVTDDLQSKFDTLNGIKVLIRGNHDTDLRNKQVLDLGWDATHDYLELDIPGSTRKFVLCHYPLEEWNGYHKNWIHLHGHLHGHQAVRGNNKIDVGVDAHDYKPWSLDQIKAITGETR